ncbi:putative negative regulator of RcsB-dependent stress response [Azomonas agilis]|uniref:Ancillary SecYEG translocon subunit n=1 Tax=Azomonas agilis TaxID=116849 RepID=A0A562J1I0_9GAMM|nr:tetratricopeptide repeat protein [Azomonas agilis]TWH76694.1 putative negative regulator of RcsB-dependent stress response [Azomonas agilis]
MSISEDEQLEQLKDWWQRSGKPLLAGCLLALIGVLVWQYWQHRTLVQTQNASILYQQLMNATLGAETPDKAEVARLGNLLKNDYANSQYAQYARLFLAKVAVDAKRLDEAATELRVLVETAKDTTVKEIARERLARIWIAQNEPQRALDMLSGTTDPVFAATREELRGDILVQLGRVEEAKQAYLKAQAALPAEVSPVLLQMKLNDLAKPEDTPSNA